MREISRVPRLHQTTTHLSPTPTAAAHHPPAARRLPPIRLLQRADYSIRNSGATREWDVPVFLNPESN
uniref:Uncharacterized protein n=1 Tax=Zea mays TaxID=4577 RepID=A0A804QFM0_MAIZE